MATHLSEAVGQVERLFGPGTLAGLSDGQLLERFLSHRDEVAFEALVHRHGKMVLGLCRRLLRNEHDVEETFQTAFLMLVRKGRGIRSPDLLGGWLYRVSYRIAVRTRSRASLRRAVEAARAVASDESSQRSAEREIEAWLLHQELSRLPEKYRLPVVLCYFQGLSHDEAARRLGWPVGTVRGRMARARAMLKLRLERRGCDFSPAWLAPLVQWPRAELIANTVSKAAVIGSTATGAPFLSFLIRTSLMNLPVRLKVAGCLLASFSLFTWVALSGSGTLSAETQPRPQAALAGEIAPDVDPPLAGAVDGRIVRMLAITKDCMVLAYLPTWDHGEVDNIGVANNNGGVELLVDWDTVSAADLASGDRKCYLAFYSRKTRAGGSAGKIEAHEIITAWHERTSWQNRPQVAEMAVSRVDFEPGDGWKVFDVTSIVRSELAKPSRSHGALIRFQQEDRAKDWSGYEFVSREGQLEFEARRPVLLLVDPN